MPSCFGLENKAPCGIDVTQHNGCQCLCLHVFCYNKQNVTLLTILHPPPASCTHLQHPLRGTICHNMRSNNVPDCRPFSPSGASLLLKSNFPDGGYLLVHFAAALHSHHPPFQTSPTSGRSRWAATPSSRARP